MIANANHPILVRLGTRMALSKIENDSSLTVEQRLAYRHVRRLGVFGDVVDAMMSHVETDDAAMAALDGQAAPGGTHPFLDWLMNGGWKSVYAIVVMILAAFGIVLPPIA